MKMYISMLEHEIEKLVHAEKNTGRLSFTTEQQLHVLFENRCHAMKYSEHEGMMPAMEDTMKSHSPY